MATTPLTKVRQRHESLTEALSHIESARLCLDAIDLGSLRNGNGWGKGWKDVCDAMILIDTAIAALRFHVNG